MEKRCSKCHNLDRIVGAHKDATGWLATVNRMKALPDSGISEEDSRIIVSYLASQMGPKGSVAAASLEVARAVVDQRCGRCHSLDRVYKTTETPEEWRATVDRMVAFAEGSGNAFQPGEDEQIIGYLSATQTPDAVNRRKAQAAAAFTWRPGMGRTSSRRAPINLRHPTGMTPERSALSRWCSLSMLTLVVRRPIESASLQRRIRHARGSRANTCRGCPCRNLHLPGGPLILRLASITQQTSDAKTLRFIVPDGRKLSARPGQFLTFSFLFDGKKVIRSYSICSSAARSGYVEITPKRVSQGCVSVFLNDRASVGMTVEANGPFGSSAWMRASTTNIVLLAAGSGITPHDGDAPLYGRPLPRNNCDPAVLRSHQQRHHIRERD